jgi:hypothetical protein
MKLQLKTFIVNYDKTKRIQKELIHFLYPHPIRVACLHNDMKDHLASNQVNHFAYYSEHSFRVCFESSWDLIQFTDKFKSEIII